MLYGKTARLNFENKYLYNYFTIFRRFEQAICNVAKSKCCS